MGSSHDGILPDDAGCAGEQIPSDSPARQTEGRPLLQEVCDDLTNKGVLGIPQDNDVIIQYCSPSFLVRKQKAKNKSKTDLTKSDVRLVVNFTKINDYLKNLPTTVVKPKDIFSQLGKWNYIVAMDLHSGFFQNHILGVVYSTKICTKSSSP